jgi:hypothetical protein
MSGLGIAFKEWAVICKALAEGQQAVILRKGGIAEAGGTFRAEHPRFWLYPTFVHQQEAGVVETARPLLEAASADRPAVGMLRLTHFAEVRRIYHLDDLDKALSLSPYHLWSRETVEARFRYREPGLYVLAVRIYAAVPHVIPEMAEYAGCKSWVALGRDLDTARASAVLDEERAEALVGELDRLLAR